MSTAAACGQASVQYSCKCDPTPKHYTRTFCRFSRRSCSTCRVRSATWSSAVDSFPWTKQQRAPVVGSCEQELPGNGWQGPDAADSSKKAAILTGRRSLSLTRRPPSADPYTVVAPAGGSPCAAVLCCRSDMAAAPHEYTCRRCRRWEMI